MWVAAAITARDGTCWARAVQQQKRNEGQELFTLAHVLRACRLAACIANLEEDETREKLSEVKLDDEQRVFVLAESIQSIDLFVVLIHGGGGRPTHAHQCALITCAHILLELAAVLDADKVNLDQLRDAAASVNDVEANNYDVSSAMAVSHASQRTLSGMARFQDWTLEKIVRAPSLVGDSLGPGLDVAVILLLPLERNRSISDTSKHIEQSRRVALSVASLTAQDAASRTLLGRKFFAVCRAGDTSLLEATETDAWSELLGTHSSTVRICETDFVIEHRSSWIMIAFQGKERPACGGVSKSVVEALSFFARYQQGKFAARFEDKESKVRGEKVVAASKCT